MPHERLHGIEEEANLEPKARRLIPVGGITNMPAFVALMGRRLEVSVLVDGEVELGPRSYKACGE